jgi:hypothetical protein
MKQGSRANAVLGSSSDSLSLIRGNEGRSASGNRKNTLYIISTACSPHTPNVSAKLENASVYACIYVCMHVCVWAQAGVGRPVTSSTSAPAVCLTRPKASLSFFLSASPCWCAYALADVGLGVVQHAHNVRREIACQVRVDKRG